MKQSKMKFFGGGLG